MQKILLTLCLLIIVKISFGQTNILPSSGNVGIGTTVPRANIEINGVTASPTSLNLNTANGTLMLSDGGNLGIVMGISNYFSGYQGYIQARNNAGINNLPYPMLINPLGGNVGIGTTTPTTKLTVAGAFTPAYMQMAVKNSTINEGIGISFNEVNDIRRGLIYAQNGNGLVLGDETNYGLRVFSGGSEVLTARSNGNVGVGTTIPLSKFQVYNGKIIAGTANATGGSVVLESQYDQAGAYGSLSVLGTNYSSGGWVLGYGITPKPGIFNSYLSATSGGIGRSAIIVENDLRFLTATPQSIAIGGDITMVERIKITNEGNMGIGTSVPTEKMTLENGNFQIQKGNGGVGSFGRVQWQNSLAYSNSARAFIEARRGSNDDGNLDFATATTTGETALVRMTINNSGNIGIGTTLPTRKLEVISTTNDIAYFRDNSTASEVNFRGNATQTIFDFGNRPLQVQFNSVPSFTLNTSGNMGIGITNPAQKLHISGNSMLSSTNPKQIYDWSGIAAFSTGIFGNTTNDTRFSIYTNSAGEAFSINYLNGSIGIGTTTIPANYKLAVAGDMIAERVVVKLQSNWPDYVFSPSYKRLTLSEVEEFISKNHHLPNIPSAQEVADNGIDVEKMNTKLLEKMEEMTLYMIEQQKEIKALRDEVKLIKDKK